MDTLKIEAKYRPQITKGSTKELRKQGFVTASIFGHDSEPISIAVKADELSHCLKKSSSGLKSIIDIKVKDAPKKSDGLVIIKDYYKDPLTKKLLDIQFQRVSLKEKVHVQVPVVLIDESPGVKEGGMLDQVMDEVTISALPGNIPPKIELSIKNLQLGQHLRVSDIPVLDGIEIISDPEAIICNCRASHGQAVAETATEAIADETSETSASNEETSASQE